MSLSFTQERETDRERERNVKVIWVLCQREEILNKQCLNRLIITDICDLDLVPVSFWFYSAEIDYFPLLTDSSPKHFYTDRHTYSSKPFSNDSEGGIKGQLSWVGSSVGQEQGPGLSTVAGLVEVTSGLLHIPNPLSQHVRDQWRIQSCVHTTDQHPSIQQQRQELRVTHLLSHLQREREKRHKL